MRSSTSERLAVPERVLLYDDPASPAVEAESLQKFLQEATGVETELRTDFFSHHSPYDLEPVATALAQTKVRSLDGAASQGEPLLGEVTFEKTLLRDPARRLPGVLYDGFALQEVLRSRIHREERSLRSLHVVLTSRLLGTLDPGDRRYHARVIVFGFPSVLSTSGLVEAPAKPREFYVAKRGFTALGMTAPTETLKEGLQGRFLDYDDPRTTEVLQGYLLQAFFYHVTGDPFCDDPKCRLFNAHWQEEVLRAQVEATLCAEHQRVLDALA